MGYNERINDTIENTIIVGGIFPKKDSNVKTPNDLLTVIDKKSFVSHESRSVKQHISENRLAINSIMKKW